MKHFSLTVFAAISIFTSAAPIVIQAQTTTTAPVIKVACCGASITQGAGTTNKALESYPAQLGRMLGDGYEVTDFGVSGRTLMNKGDHPYQTSAAWPKSLAFNPDIVTIMLGTNDSKAQNWLHKDDFILDFKEMIEKYKALPSHPRIYLCYPPLVVGSGKYGINEQNVKLEIPMFNQIAKDEGADIIDTQSTFIGHESLLPDDVHPNNDGATLLAKTIYKALKGTDFAGDVPSPTPIPSPTPLAK